MRLSDLIREEDNLRVFGPTDVLIKGLTSHSQEVRDGYIFFAHPGSKLDGRSFIFEAIGAGAKVIVTNSLPERLPPDITYLLTPEVKKILALFTKRFYDRVDEKMTLIGVTGTCGKTTVVYLVRHLFLTTGKDAGLISTIKNYDGRDWEATKNTTPEIYKIFPLLKTLHERGIEHCVMEVSSHALALDRVYGLRYKVACFTNLSPEHLDFHKDLEDYKKAKMKLFIDLSPNSFAVGNLDDPVGKEILKLTPAKKVSYGLKKGDLRGEIKEMRLSGMRFVIEAFGERRIGHTFLLGEMNLYNILAAFGIGWALGLKSDAIMAGIETFRGVKGRLERVENERGVNAFVDYAHTPKALESLLLTLRPLSKKIILVFGCGGDRDKEKRPVMGEIATSLADWVIITSDNPRSEDPKTIISEIVKGIKKSNYQVILDRREAIKKAVHLTKRGETLIVAGKGHEEYQIIGERMIRFSDREELERFLRD